MLVGVGLMALGAGAFVLGSSQHSEPTRRVGGNLPVNGGASDPLDITAHNSPALARNPLRPGNLAVANRIDTPRFSCALHISLDGGASWKQGPIPFPEGEEAPPRCYAPDLTFGPDGTMYLLFVTLKGPGNVPNAGWMVTSSDEGKTLSTPMRVLGPLAFQARLVADRTAGRRLYLSWLQARDTATLGFPEAGNPIMVSVSEDGGATWGQPVRVSPPARQRVVAPSLAVGPTGTAYVLYVDVGEDVLDYHGAHEGRGGEPYSGRWSLVLARSGDRASTWKEQVVDDSLVPTERFVVFLPSSPALAVDQRTGRVYVGFHDGRLGDADVWLRSSPGGGDRFGPRQRVNDTAPKDGTSQYLPQLGVAPNGRLDVLYYDRRRDRANVENEVSLQSSTDQGRSFSARVPVSDRVFDSRIGFGSERGLPDLGSRLGLVSAPRRALAVWTDTRSGTEASNKQDVARAVIVFGDEPPWRQPLRVGGLGVAAIGLLVALALGFFGGGADRETPLRSSTLIV